MTNRATRLFKPVGGKSIKVHCTVCTRQGYDTRGTGWQAACLRGHKPCRRCGRMLPVLANGKARPHPRCPGKEPDDPSS